MSFKVGDRVVCIDSAYQKKDYWLSEGFKFPVEGECYTIRDFTPSGNAIRLIEINNSHMSHRTNKGLESGFKIYRFRKLDYDFVEEVISNLKEEPVKI